MKQKTVLITGCSSGIGYDAAHAMKARGWRVFASCRAAEDCGRLKDEGFESPLIDYCDADTIAAGLTEVFETTGGTLDAVFNNGAHGMLGAVEDIPTDALRAIFESNFFGYHELTRRVIPVMRAQGHGRIVQCSSVLGLVTMRWRGAYNASKFALEGLNDTLRIELRDANIHISLIEPGPITTKFRQKGVKHFEKWINWEKSPHADRYRDTLIPRLYAPPGKPDPFELPASAVSQKLIHALESVRPRPRYYVTKVTYIMGNLKRILPTRALDWVIARY